MNLPQSRRSRILDFFLWAFPVLPLTAAPGFLILSPAIFQKQKLRDLAQFIFEPCLVTRTTDAAFITYPGIYDTSSQILVASPIPMWCFSKLFSLLNVGMYPGEPSNPANLIWDLVYWTKFSVSIPTSYFLSVYDGSSLVVQAILFPKVTKAFTKTVFCLNFFQLSNIVS